MSNKNNNNKHKNRRWLVLLITGITQILITGFNPTCQNPGKPDFEFCSSLCSN